MKQRIVPLLAAALALTVMLAGCSSQEEAEPLPQGMDTETVLTAGEAVLDQLLEGDYEAVYESFREDIRADLTAQSVQDLVEPGVPGGGGLSGAQVRPGHWQHRGGGARHRPAPVHLLPGEGVHPGGL